MYTKATIFNLALGDLLLQRTISNADTDPSNECKVLNTNYDIAFRASLEDMDLDSTSTIAVLPLLIEHPVEGWRWAYKYPQNCAFLRRLVPRGHHQAHPDNRFTHISKRVGMYSLNGVNQKVIFTNHECASAEYIAYDLPLSSLSATAGMPIAHRLAIMSSPLIVGKGASELREEIQKKYIMSKAEAQAQDARENFNFESPQTESEFVAIRTS